MGDDAKEWLDEILQTDESGGAEWLDESRVTADAILKTETWKEELSKVCYRAVNKPCVICVATDETNSKWRRSRYCYSLPLSSSISDLYSTIAKEAGMHPCILGWGSQMVLVLG